MERRRLSGATPLKTEAPSLKPKKRVGGNYFPDADKALSFVPTGCALLDCTLGGGWALGRFANIVGDKSTGKTLLAIEACANMSRKFAKAKIYYREAESAFDVSYAKKLGLPETRVDFGKKGIDTPWDTVEDVIEDLDEKLTAAEKSGQEGLYIVDSLDALSSRAELARKLDKGSYGMEKPKAMSELFRRLKGRIKRTNMGLIIVSQVRDKIGFVVGEKHTRSGGHAMDFYASQILWLSHLRQVTATSGGVKRVVGIRVLANCKKNKVTNPFHKCEFKIKFGYGVDDVEASLAWLEEHKMLHKLGIKPSQVGDYLDDCEALITDADYRKRSEEVRAVVVEAWGEVEARFEPQRRKYS